MGVNQAFTADYIDGYCLIPAGAAVQSTASDLGKYIRFYLSEGLLSDNSRFLSTESIDMIFSPYLSLAGLSYEMGGTGENRHYGFGWFINEIDGRTLVGHGGNAMTMSSQLTMDRKKGIGVALLFNADFHDSGFNHATRTKLTNDLLHIVLNESLSDYGIPRVPDPNYLIPPVKLPHELHRELAGTFRSPQGATARIRKEGESAIVTVNEEVVNFESEILYITGNRILLKNPQETYQGFFTRNSKGNISVIHCKGVSYSRIDDSQTRISAGSSGYYSFLTPDESLSWKWKGEKAIAILANGSLSITMGSTSDTSSDYIERGWIQDPVKGRLWLEKTDVQSNGRWQFTAILPGSFRIELIAGENSISHYICDYIPPLLESLLKDEL